MYTSLYRATTATGFSYRIDPDPHLPFSFSLMRIRRDETEPEYITTTSSLHVRHDE